MGVENNIPEGWVETTLGDISSRKQYGYTESASNEKVGPKFLRITDIQNDFISWNKVPYCPISDEDFTKYKLQVGDVVIARTGNSTGATATIKDKINAVFASYLIRFQINKQIADYNFIDFLVRSKLWYGFVKSVKSGSAQGGANANDFALFPINLPLIPEQKSIAKVLTAFDNKIELLQAQNKTLENMAQTIFKEWFGKYQIGDELPEGWRVGKLGDIANLKSGYAFKSKDFVEESSKNALKIKDLKGDGKVSLNAVSCVSNDVTKLSRVQYFRLKEGDIVLAMSGNTTGKIGVIPPHSNEVYLNQRVGKFFMIKQDLNSFLYSFLMSGNYEEKILSMGYGSAQPNISPSQIENIDIIYPNEEKLVSFLNISNPIFNKVLDNNNQIQSLTKTRDTLLPKLMSGQVRVNNIKQTANA
jgi:type I restriction enzyme S subunit